MPEIFLRPEIIAYSNLMAESFAKCVEPGAPPRDLLADIHADRALPLAEALFKAPVPLVSHGVETQAPGPIFRYANLAALALWEMHWADFTRLPSIRSAPDTPEIQAERAAFVNRARDKGWIDDYTGTRISSTGKLFVISNVILWNVTDAGGARQGQAALIRNWTPK